jgi:EpsD family peptidyl-prolyl cis-trans isomerase
MASRALIIALVTGLGLATAGCDQIRTKLGGQPKGQVVATVNGEEVTSLELRSELGGFSSRDPKVFKQAQDQALQQIIIRTLLAQKAKAQKLDKVPQFTLQLKRGGQTLLAQLYEGKLFGKVAPPTQTEAANFVSAHPDQFANRRIYVVDQIVAPSQGLKKEELLPLKSLEEVKAYLDNKAVPYQENIAAIDSLSADEKILKPIEALPPGEVFIVNQAPMMLFNRIERRKDAPLRGPAAMAQAEAQLRQLQALDFVRTQLLGMRRSAESSITYAKGYKPDNPDAGIAPITGAPGAPEKK